MQTNIENARPAAAEPFDAAGCTASEIAGSYGLSRNHPLLRLATPPKPRLMFPAGRHRIIAPARRLTGIFGEALAAYITVADKYTLQDVMENHAAPRPPFGLQPAFPGKSETHVPSPLMDS